MARNNLCSPSSIGRWAEIEDAHEEAEINNLARDLMESGMNVKQWLPMRELTAAHRDLQPYIQSTNDPLMNAMNDDMATALNIIENSVANLNDIKNTSERLQYFDLPSEAIEIVNENGRRICTRTADTIHRSFDSIRRDRQVLETSFKMDKRKKEQWDRIEIIFGGILLASLAVVAATGLVASGIGLFATMNASSMTVTEGGVIAASIGGSIIIGKLKDEQR